MEDSFRRTKSFITCREPRSQRLENLLSLKRVARNKFDKASHRSRLEANKVVPLRCQVAFSTRSQYSEVKLANSPLIVFQIAKGRCPLNCGIPMAKETVTSRSLDIIKRSRANGIATWTYTTFRKPLHVKRIPPCSRVSP